jgi:hypothetical protein
VANYAQQFFQQHPDATLGDFYASYVMGTGKSGGSIPLHKFDELKTFQAVNSPGDAYRNFLSHSPQGASVLLRDILGAA